MIGAGRTLYLAAAVAMEVQAPSLVQTPAAPVVVIYQVQSKEIANLDSPPGVSFSVHHFAVHRYPLS